MKKIVLFIALLLSVGFAYSQVDENLSPEEKARRQKNIDIGNPFARFGYKPKIATLSKGKYLEFHDRDTIVKIGSFSYHTRNHTVTGYYSLDSLRSEATLHPTLISRWFSPDPLSDEFPSWSPYSFVYNNPIRFIDPMGLAPEDIIINYVDADGNKQQVNYEYGQKYKGDNAFVGNVFKALNHLVDNNADAAGVIKTLSGDELGDVNVFQNNAKNNSLFNDPKRQTYFNSEGENSGGAEVIWDSHLGAEFTNENGIVSWLLGGNYKDEQGMLSPAEGLLHELGHGESFLSNPKQHKKDSQTILTGKYSNKEEFDVITKVENPASKALNHVVRKGHYGRMVKVKSPTSIKKVK